MSRKQYIGMLNHKVITLQNQICDRFGGNSFAAATYVARIARKHLSETKNRILDSQAVSWAVSGHPPTNINLQEVMSLQSEINKMKIDEIISNIYDEDVRDGVYISVKESYKSHTPVYVYVSSDEHKCARVRILTNMIWNNFTDYTE